MKNLLIIHLESLNNYNFLLNKYLFPFLNEIETQSVSFKKYFSTATSTLMTIGDLLYGGMDQYETSSSLDDAPEAYLYKSSLMDDLKNIGYYTGIYIYPDGNNRDSAEEKHLAGFQNKMILKNNYEEYLEAFSKGMEKMPFALMACDYTSNSAFNKYAIQEKNRDGFLKWEAGYKAIDNHARDLFNMIREKGLEKSTVLVFYGDHGDDYWTHSFRHGMTHAIEPNALLIHTPMFIYDPDMNGSSIIDNDTLISTIDIRKLVMNILQTESDWMSELKKIKREYIYSRSAYAAQSIGDIHYFKSYAVCDGKFLILVSPEGMALYHILMDNDCHNNLLMHFNLENGKLVDDLDDSDYYYQANWGFWWEPTRRKIRQIFYYLREILYKETLHSYIAGGRTEEEMNAEMDFQSIIKYQI